LLFFSFYEEEEPREGLGQKGEAKGVTQASHVYESQARVNDPSKEAKKIHRTSSHFWFFYPGRERKDNIKFEVLKGPGIWPACP
jgi:hypothetical protein